MNPIISEQSNIFQNLWSCKDRISFEIWKYSYYCFWFPAYKIAGNIIKKDLNVEISLYLFMKVINWKENKEVGTIGFEVKIPMRRTEWIFFPKKIYSYLDSTIIFWKKAKIFIETLLYHQKAFVSDLQIVLANSMKNKFSNGISVLSLAPTTAHSALLLSFNAKKSNSNYWWTYSFQFNSVSKMYSAKLLSLFCKSRSWVIHNVSFRV